LSNQKTNKFVSCTSNKNKFIKRDQFSFM